MPAKTMTRVITSLADAVAHFDDELAALRASQMTIEAIAVTALRTLLETSEHDADTIEHAPAQLAAATFDSGDNRLNHLLRAAAQARLEWILGQLATDKSH